MTIVMGPSCAGKSTYIKEHFPNAKIIDLYDFQDVPFQTYETIMHSYEECAEALQKALKEGGDVVLEHTLLKAKRRAWYIEKIREVSDEDIDIVCLTADIDTLVINSIKRGIDFSVQYCQNMLDTLELPKLEEGYRSVKIISST